MEVINPIILAGGAPGGAGQQPTIYKANTLVGDYSEEMISYYYEDFVTISGPFLYILKPGDYVLPASGLDVGLLQQYGVTKGEFNYLYIAGNVRFTGTSRYMNFCATYDQAKDYHFMHCNFYTTDNVSLCYLPVLQGEQGRAAVALNGLYSGYGEYGKISLADLRKPWRDYTTLDLFYMHLEE